MKHLKGFLCALALAVAAYAQTASPSVDEIVAKHLAAQGGADKIKAINSMKITAKGLTQGLELPMTIYIKRPNFMRSEVSVQDKSIVQAFDGKDSWSINPMTGADEPSKAGEAESKNMRERAEYMIGGRLMDYREKGTTVELVGKEDVEGSPAYKLKVTPRSGTTGYEFLDTATYLEVKSTAKVIQMGQELEVESYASNYKPVNGVMLPHAIDQRVGAMGGIKMVVEKYEVNTPIDNAIFQFPSKPKADEKKQ